MRIAVALTVALLVAGCASKESRERLSEGAASAERDIAEGNPSLLFIGLPSPDRSIMDRETGLPTHSYGCVISDRSAAYVDAYNRTIRDALDEGRLKGMTLAHKWMSREDVDDHVDGTGGHELVLDGPAVKNPSGDWSVFLRPHLGDTPYVWVRAHDSGESVAMMYLGEPKARVHFAHEGTTLIVRDHGYRRTFTIDLPRRQEMQNFPDDDR